MRYYAPNRPPAPAGCSFSVAADKKVVDETALKARLAQAAEAQPQPELHLFADKNVRYESVAKVLSQAQTAGITKLGFVTAPDTK